MSDLTSPIDSPHEIIATLIKRLHENYVFPELVPTIASTLNQYLEDGIYTDSEDHNQRAQKITQHLQEAGKDKHLRVRYQAEGVSLHVDEDELYTPAEIEEIRHKSRQNYGIKKVEILTIILAIFN